MHLTLLTVGPVPIVFAAHNTSAEQAEMHHDNGCVRLAYWCMEGDCRCLFVPDEEAGVVFMDRFTMLSSSEPRQTCDVDNGACACHSIPGTIEYDL